MGQASVYIFPKDNETARFYSGVGLICVAMGIHFSAGAKAFLSNGSLLWFGRNSFAVYLLHGSLLRTVLVWMYFGLTVPGDVVQEEDGKTVLPGPPLKICGRARWYFWLPIWFVGLYWVANLWTRHVDPWCARLSERMVRYVFEDRALLLLQQQQTREHRPDPPMVAVVGNGTGNRNENRNEKRVLLPQ